MSYIIGFPHTSVFLVYQIIPALKYNASCTQFSLTYLSFYQSRYFIHIFLISDSIGWCKSKLLPLCHTRLKKNRVNPDILLLGSNIQHGRIKRCLPADTLIGFKWRNLSREQIHDWAGAGKGLISTTDGDRSLLRIRPRGMVIVRYCWVYNYVKIKNSISL